MKKHSQLLTVFVLLMVTVLQSGCLLSRGGSGGSGEPPPPPRTVAGYIRGRLPETLVISTSAAGAPEALHFAEYSPRYSPAIAAPGDWSIKPAGVNRSVNPSSDGLFSIVIYTEDNFTANPGDEVQIEVEYKSKAVAGTGALETAQLYSPEDIPELPLSDKIVAIFLEGGTFRGKSDVHDNTDYAANLFEGWGHFISGDFDDARAEFEQVLDSSDATAADRAKAYAGKGWCRVRTDGISDSQVNTLFGQAQVDSLGKLGRACYYVARGTNISSATSLLVDLGLSAPTYRFTAGEIVDVSSDAAHALLAMCYAYTGRNDLAELQIAGRSGSAGSVENQVAQLLQKFGAF